MKTETKKIAMACFIGGFICAAVAVAVNLIFWWLGMLAGFAAGYFAYEFKSVLRAAPVAWKNAKKGGVVAGQEIKNWFKEWVFKKHPAWHPFAIVFCLFGYVMLLFVIDRLILACPSTSVCPSTTSELVLTILVMLLLIAIVSYLITMISMLLVFDILIMIGAENENCEVNFGKENYEKSDGLTKAINYSDFFRWWVKGLSLAIKWTIFFLAWKMWRGLAIGIWKTTCFFARFLKNLFILIHSNKRLLCGIDGSIGGAVAYIWLASPAMDIWSKTILCVFGGLIGAGFGTLNYEVVSKRILRLPTNGV